VGKYKFITHSRSSVVPDIGEIYPGVTLSIVFLCFVVRITLKATITANDTDQLVIYEEIK
jgi:hypothetical protein